MFICMHSEMGGNLSKFHYLKGVSNLWNGIWIEMWNGMMEWIYITI